MQKEMLLVTLDQDVKIHLTKGKNVLGKLASHFHCAYTIGVIEKGKIELTYEDKKVCLSEGGFYVMSPFSVHCVRFVEPTCYRVFTLKTEVIECLVKHFNLVSTGKQNKQIAKALVEAYDALASEQGTYGQKQILMKHLLEMIENEQKLMI